MSEKALDNRIARLFRRRRGWHWKTHGSGIGRAGIPDHIGCVPLTIRPEHVGQTIGAFVAVEAKAPGGKATPLQRYELERIAAAGGTALVARSITEVEQALDAIEKGEGLDAAA